MSQDKTQTFLSDKAQMNNTSSVALVNNSSVMQNTSNSKQINTAINNEKYSEEEYSNYIDSSDVVIQTYKNSSTVGLEKHFLSIEEWLDRPLLVPEDNKPYVIEADEGVGKKTLLVKWMEYHEQKKKKYPDIILSHFASLGGNNANYFFAIYRILNKLREALEIQQKIELLEEKLRKYFDYLLNHCSDKLEKQLKYGEKVNYDKVIIIIEGIDLFNDQQYNKEANVAFWLPKFFPQHIKLIVTCDKKSQANTYFKSIGCQVQQIQVDLSIVQSMVQRHSGRPLFVNEQIRIKHIDILKEYPDSCKNQSFNKVFMCTFLPYPVEDVIRADEIPSNTFEKMFESLDYKKLKGVTNSKELMDYILEFYQNHLMIKDKFIKLMRIFTLTQKGLTIEEVMEMTGITEAEWKLFMACFKVFVINYNGYLIMNNNTMKRVFLKKYEISVSEVRQQHQEIAQVLDKITPNSIRKLEEQTYHLFMSKDHFKLKEIISTIENFLLLFNPNNKYDLCRYWQNLEEQGFDPVIEYNKAIEGFEMHYHPSSQDVFRIIVQISRFLKEFSDFETYFTPEFRHPPVKGTYEELDDIGLLRELLGLEIFQPTEAEEKEKPDLDKFIRTSGQKIEDKMQKMKTRNKKESTLKKRSKDDDPYGSAPTQKKPQPSSPRGEKREKKFQILSKIESVNVDIPNNREQFRKFYENHIKEIIHSNSNGYNEAEGDVGTEQGENSDENDSNNEENFNEDEGQSSRPKSDGDKTGPNYFLESTKSKKKKNQQEVITIEQLREAYNLKERTPTNYYYKRWLWVQFPWACLSLKCDYSAKLKECFSSPIEYMSVKKEKEFTKQALKIAIEAKLKKQMMYKKSAINDSLSIIKPAGGGDSILMKTSTSANNLPSLQKTRKANSLIEMQPAVGSSQLNSKSNTLGNTVTMNSSRRSLKASNARSPFYITQEYLFQNTLNKEIEATPNALAIANAAAPPTGKVENTSKVLERSKVFKDKTKLFDPISNIQDANNLSTILPRLKGGINSHSTKELYLLENQALDMKRELDNLINTNKLLAHQLKELKFTQHNNLVYGSNPEKIEDAQKRVSDLEKSIKETEENYMLGIMQIERLESILKICGDNKTQNEDWIRNLNYLLTNFRKMIRIEQESIKQSQEECIQLEKINKEYVNVFSQKMEAQKTLISQINNSVDTKKRFDSMFGRTDMVIEQSASGQIEKMKMDQKGLDNRKKQKDRQSQLEKNSKSIQEQLEKAESQFHKIKEVIDISDSSYSNTEKFQKLLAAREKRDDLAAIVLQRQGVIQSLQEKLLEKQSYLETLQRAYPEHQQKQVPQHQEDQEQAKKEESSPKEEENVDSNQLQLLKAQQLENNVENKERQYNKYQQVRLSAAMTIETLQKKLNLPQSQDIKNAIDFSEESIITKLNEYVEFIKSKLSPEEYESFEGGNYDFSKVYKQLIANGAATNMQNDDEGESYSQKDF